MSDFSDNHITNLGTGLLAQVMAGQGKLTFTKVVMGDGNMPSTQTPATMTDVVSPKAQAGITKAAVAENGTAVVSARFTNESQEDDFEWKELGLYAKVGESGTEVLYSYGYTPQGEIIPAGTTSTTLIEKLVDVVTYIGDATEVTAIFDPTFVPNIERVDEADLSAMWDAEVDPTTGKSTQYLDRPGLSQLVHDIADAIANAGPNITADEVTLTVDDDGVVSIKALGVGTAQLADASVTTAKLADGAVTTVKLADGAVTADKLADGAVTIDQIDLSTVTPDAIGAAAAEHVHDAADVTTGVLAVERGGTGVSSDDAAFQKYVVAHYVQDKEELKAYLGLT